MVRIRPKNADMFEPTCIVGASFLTATRLQHSSQLLPIAQDCVKAMLKLSQEKGEGTGSILMEWWCGNGAATVLMHEDGTLLMNRANGSDPLSTISRSGRNHEACRSLCTAVARLHAPRNTPLPNLCTSRLLVPCARTNGASPLAQPIMYRADSAWHASMVQ
jgi:streptomycin 6-kinase